MKKNRLWILGFLGLAAAVATSACVVEKDDDDNKDNIGAGGSGGSNNETDGGDDTDAGESDGGDDTDAGESDGGEQPQDYIEECGEADDNNSKEKAIAVTPNVRLCLSDDDVDWLKVTTPDDGKAHLIEIAYDQGSGFAFGVHAYADADNSFIAEYYTDPGTKKSLYLTVGPNTTTYLKFDRIGEAATVDLKFTVTAENDDYEPNNERSAAAQVNLNEDIKGQLWLGYVDEESEDTVAEDWFKVDLEEGTAKVKFTQVPEDQNYVVKIYDSNGAEIQQLYGNGDGATWEDEFEVETAGTHYFRLSTTAPYGPLFYEGKGKGLSEQYVFQIQQ